MSDLNRTMERAAEILDRTASIVAADGEIIASTNPSLVGEVSQEAASFFHGNLFFQTSDTHTYVKLMIDNTSEYVAMIDGNDHTSQTYISLLSQWVIAELEDTANSEDIKDFLKNILFDNELPGDITFKAGEFRINSASRRICYLIKLEHEDDQSMAYHVLLNLFPKKKIDFVLNLEEDVIILIKDLQKLDDEEIDSIASTIVDNLSSEGVAAHIGIGMPADTLKDIAKSYQEASLSVTVGKIFTPESRLMRYDRLGLGRLIYQLPPTLCHLFLDEVFPEGSYESLDSETLQTIEQFFDNNLNGSETSRKLFVHRNTLVYRLDKAQKITGLDLRSFDDAVMFKFASMVRTYLEYQDRSSLQVGSPKWWRKK